MNNDSWFNIDTGTSNKEYSPVDKKDKKKYIESVLSYKKFNYEFELKPKASEVYDLMGKAYENFEKIMDTCFDLVNECDCPVDPKQKKAVSEGEEWGGCPKCTFTTNYFGNLIHNYK